MSTSGFVLGLPPSSQRRRELWLQHAAGFILFEDVRNYAIERLDRALDATARAAALKAIDDAVYGLMMVIDGVSGGLGNAEHLCDVRHTADLDDGEQHAQLGGRQPVGPGDNLGRRRCIQGGLLHE